MALGAETQECLQPPTTTARDGRGNKTVALGYQGFEVLIPKLKSVFRIRVSLRDDVGPEICQ